MYDSSARRPPRASTGRFSHSRRRGQGAIERIEAGDPNRFRLRVDSAEARLFIDTRARTILVTRIYRRRGS